MVGSILICAVIYVLLQFAYLGAVSPDLLAKSGWSGINFSSPYAQLALALNLNWLAICFYADAFVEPERHRHRLTPPPAPA